MKSGSKVLAARDYRWPVALRPYKEGGELYRDVTRQTLRPSSTISIRTRW